MIFTFYSYKGGVGRSMALANVGAWLHQQGLRVLLVDWDLEAPGIENYFVKSADEAESVRERAGVIDLLMSYKRQLSQLDLDPGTDDPAAVLEVFERELPPLSTYTVSLGSNGSTSTLDVLTAGLRGDEHFANYAEAVQGFDWQELYTAYRGEEFFEWLRRSVERSYDVVFIDSRTGVTEMGGVCTRQLADVVVSFCVPNVSNLEGVLTMAQTFARDDLELPRYGRPLQNVIVPARLETSERDERIKFRDTFTQATDPFLPDLFRENRRTFWSLRIPYVPFYAYREALCIGEHGTVEELEESYKNLAAHLVLLSPPDSVLHQRCRAELGRVLSITKMSADTSLPPAELDIWMAREATNVFDGMSALQQESALSCLARLVHAEGDQPLTPRSASVADLGGSVEPVRGFLNSGLLLLAGDSAQPGSVVRAQAPFNLGEWRPLKQWIDERRSFVVWRQRVAQMSNEWAETRQNPDLLLRGPALDSAAEHLRAHADLMNEREHNFIAASIAAHEARQRHEEERRAAEALNEDRARRAEKGVRNLRYAVAAAAVLAGVAAGSWSLYARTTRALILGIQSEGTKLIERIPANSVKRIQEWLNASVLAGAYADAIRVAGLVPEDDRVETFAALAKSLHTAGQPGHARAVAHEALELARRQRLAAPSLLLVAQLFDDHPEFDSIAVVAAKEALRRHQIASDTYRDFMLDNLSAQAIAGLQNEGQDAFNAQLSAAEKLPPDDRFNRLAELCRVATEFDSERFAVALFKAAERVPELDRSNSWVKTAECMSRLERPTEVSQAAQHAFEVTDQRQHQSPAGDWLTQARVASGWARLARRLHRLGKPLLATESAQRALAVASQLPALAAEPDGDDLLKEAFAQAVEVLALNRKSSEAFKALESAGAASRDRNPLWETAVIAHIARALAADHQNDAAISAADAALTRLASVPVTNDTTDVLLTIAEVYVDAGIPGKAREQLQHAASSAAVHDEAIQVRLARAWARVGEYRRAREVADTMRDVDRLSVLATVLFEYWSKSNDELAKWLAAK